MSERRYRVGGMCLSCGAIHRSFSTARAMPHGGNDSDWAKDACNASKGYIDVYAEKRQPTHWLDRKRKK